MYLNCHSYYSLRYGTIPETALLAMAGDNGVSCLALTDINTTSACLNFVKEAQGMGIKPIVGADIRNGAKQFYILLAQNNLGYREINAFISRHLHHKKPFPDRAPHLEGTFLIYPFERVLELEKTEFASHEYIGISIRDLRRLPFSKLKNKVDRLVVQQPVTFRNQTDFNAHRLLRAIDLNILLSKLDFGQQAELGHRMVPVRELTAIFGDFPHILENTKALMDRCSVDFRFGKDRLNQNQRCYLDSREEDIAYLRRLCSERIGKRYPVISGEVRSRLERELRAIEQLDFVGYFLINDDILGYARSKNYPYIGRGSGANSMVAYILGITNVDPIELDLYFERFINAFRSSPPDFDIDFSWRDRDDVTRYIFERFDHCALMGTYVTFQYRAVIRELSKVFGIPKAETDNFLNGKYKTGQSDKYLKLVIKYANLIHGFPNYLSVHSGGIIITQEPVHSYTGTFLPPKGFPTIQFDMIIAEDVGIYKFDILAQRGLSKISDTLEIVRYNQPNAEVRDIDAVHHFKTDPLLNQKLSVGDCMGVFYVESPAMRGLMTKLRTSSYIGLVAASSIIRPGVGNGGRKNEYIERERDPEKRKDAHPVLGEILKETHGVMVYQEDVLKVAHYFAGLSLAEADILRRGMSGKHRSKKQFMEIEEKFKRNCLAKGYSEELTLDVWDQVKAFAGYAFAKGHSASYAVESYQSLYLKEYFPLEFMTAVLNNGGGFYNVETYVNEIRKRGGEVEAPCIQTSDHPNIIVGRTVYLGFGMVKDLEGRTVQKSLNERQLNGPFKSLSDFIQRIKAGLEQLILLIRVGAFRFTGKSKKELLWEAHLLTNADRRRTVAPTLFRPETPNYKLPRLRSLKIEDAYDEIELLEFPLCSRFDLLEEEPPKYPTARDLKDLVGRSISIWGSVVTAKRVPLKDNKTMYFGTFADRHGDFFDTVHFPASVEKSFMSGKEVYQITGDVTEEMGYYSITVDLVRPLKRTLDPRVFGLNQSHKNIS